MPYFALFYDVADDFVARREPFRSEHLRLAAESHKLGEIVLAGALAEPPAALIIFHSADKSAAEEFAGQDPYVLNGLVKNWTVRLWNVVVGQPSDTVSSSGGRLQ
jgi:uncharacterized protein YciI